MYAWKALSATLIAALMMLGGLADAAEPTRTDALFYTGYLDYGTGTQKESANIGGAYVYYGVGNNHLFEGSVDYLDLSIRNQVAFRQTDYTFLYSNFSRPNWKFRAGFHGLSGDDPLTDSGRIAILGAHQYVPGVWEGGVDLYLSSYDNLKATQVSPHYGFGFKGPGLKPYRGDLTGHYIKLDRAVAGLADRSFTSLEVKVTRYSDRWSQALFGWFGDQSFAVRDGGFTVYNLSERHTGGLGLEARYVINAKNSIKFRVAKEKFVDIGAAQKTRVVSGVLIYGHTF